MMTWTILLAANLGVRAQTNANAEWMKGTTWHWNNWRDVVFEADGAFQAPTPECESGGRCTWTCRGNEVRIEWGSSGLHRLVISDDRKSMNGRRVADGEKCSASFKKSGAGGAVAIADEDSDDLYAVLGVSEDATAKEIKKAYRKLSIKYHPDKNRNNAAAKAKFTAVREAYEVLGKADKKLMYDMGGLEAVKEVEKEDAQGGAAAANPFAAFFGGGQQKNGKRGADANVGLDVSLEDMYNGNTITMEIKRRVVCRRCNTKKRRKKHARCKGCGRCPNEVRTVLKQMGFMQVQQQEEVPSKERCKEAAVPLTATIEKGMAAGSEVRFPLMSEQSPGKIPGDVVFQLKQKPHSLFTRSGDDLSVTLDITLKQALLGFETTLTHLDGHIVKLRHINTGPVKPEERERVVGEGMPQHNFPSQHGDLFVTWHIIFPKTLTAEQVAGIEAVM